MVLIRPTERMTYTSSLKGEQKLIRKIILINIADVRRQNITFLFE